MARFLARVDISHLPGVADPAGATVERALPALGWSNVTELKIAKSIRLVIEAESGERASAQVAEMCERILANPVIESYEIAITELVEA